MKAHSTPDYLSDIEESTKQLKEQLEEVKKANEMNQREEQLKQIREKFKQNINYNKVLMKLFDTYNIESKPNIESVSEFFLFLSLHLTDQDFMLKNYNYDIENKRFTGLIKNERNNRSAYFIVNRTNNVDWLFHLVVLQDENEINKIPDYPTNKQDWIGLEHFESTLIDLLK